METSLIRPTSTPRNTVKRRKRRDDQDVQNVHFARSINGPPLPAWLGTPWPNGNFAYRAGFGWVGGVGLITFIWPGNVWWVARWVGYRATWSSVGGKV